MFHIPMGSKGLFQKTRFNEWMTDATLLPQSALTDPDPPRRRSPPPRHSTRTPLLLTNGETGIIPTSDNLHDPPPTIRPSNPYPPPPIVGDFTMLDANPNPPASIRPTVPTNAPTPPSIDHQPQHPTPPLQEATTSHNYPLAIASATDPSALATTQQPPTLTEQPCTHTIDMEDSDPAPSPPSQRHLHRISDVRIHALRSITGAYSDDSGGLSDETNLNNLPPPSLHAGITTTPPPTTTTPQRHQSATLQDASAHQHQPLVSAQVTNNAPLIPSAGQAPQLQTNPHPWPMQLPTRTQEALTQHKSTPQLTPPSTRDQSTSGSRRKRSPSRTASSSPRNPPKHSCHEIESSHGRHRYSRTYRSPSTASTRKDRSVSPHSRYRSRSPFPRSSDSSIRHTETSQQASRQSAPNRK